MAEDISKAGRDVMTHTGSVRVGDDCQRLLQRTRSLRPGKGSGRISNLWGGLSTEPHFYPSYTLGFF